MLKEKKWLLGAMLSFAFTLIHLLNMPLIAADLPKKVQIATHPKGTSLNIIGSGMAKVISMHTSISAVDRPYTGYTAWLPLLNKGQIDMGIGTNPDAYSSYRN